MNQNSFITKKLFLLEIFFPFDNLKELYPLQSLEYRAFYINMHKNCSNRLFMYTK